jgi:hypothetical protein
MMGRLSVAALTIAVGCLAVLDLACAEPARRSGLALASDVSAQQRPVRRARTRIIVYPRSPYEGSIGRSGNRFDVFPRPYRYEWPGPNAQRECVGWLEPEHRLTGTVIVPRRRCRWVPG